MDEQRSLRTTTEIPPHHDPTIDGPSDKRFTNTTTGLGTQYSYYNGLEYPVHVVLRNGIQFTIPPVNYGGRRVFAIRTVVSHANNVKIDISRLFNNSTETSKSLLATLKEVQDKGLVERTMENSTLSYFYKVTQEDLNNGGNSLYLPHLDVVISTLEGQLPQHPYSEEGLLTQNLEVFPTANDANSFGYNIQIVDNHGCYGRRFINIGNVVYSIPTAKRPTMPDGVYLISNGPCQVEGGITEPVTERYTFEEADEKLPIYRTIEEARTLGDQVAQMEKELKENSLYLKREEQRLAQEAQEFKRMQAEEEQRRKVEEQRIKADLEEEERRRKREWEEEERLIKQQREAEEVEIKRKREEEEYAIKKARDEEKAAYERDKLMREREEAEDKRRRRMEEEEFKREMERLRNAEELRQREALAEHERRLKRLKEKEEELEHRRKMEDLRRKEEYEKRSAERKDHYEEQSAKRKESSEIVKFIPAIITGIFAIAIAITKFT